MVYHASQSRYHLLGKVKTLVADVILHLHIVLTSFARSFVSPRLNKLPFHRSEDVYYVGKARSVCRHRTAYQHSLYLWLFRLYGYVCPHIVCVIYKLVVVEVGQSLWLQFQLQGKHSASVLQRGHAHTENLLYQLALLHQIYRYRWVGIRYKDVSFKLSAVSAYRLGYLAVFFLQLSHIGIAYHLASERLNLFEHVVYHHIAFALQSPAAFYETAVSVGKGKEGQGLLAQFHLYACSAYDADEQFIVNDGTEIVVSVSLLQPLLVCGLQHLHIFLQSLALLRKILRQFVHEVLVALSKPVCLALDVFVVNCVVLVNIVFGYLVKALRVEPLPRQVEQSQFLERIMQGLSLVQSAYVV